MAEQPVLTSGDISRRRPGSAACSGAARIRRRSFCRSLRRPPVAANPVDLCAQSDLIGAPELMKIEAVLGAQIGYRSRGTGGYQEDGSGQESECWAVLALAVSRAGAQPGRHVPVALLGRGGCEPEQNVTQPGR